VVFVPGLSLELDRMTIELAGLQLKGPNWETDLKKGVLATERVTDGSAPDFAHRLGFSSSDLSLPAALKAKLDPAGLLPQTFNSAEVDATAVFDAPWDKAAIEGRKPLLTGLNIRTFELNWGKLLLSAKGQVDVDQNGFPVGDIEVRAVNWKEMLDVAVASGLLDPEVGNAVRSGLGLLSRLSGDGAEIAVPLSFSNGKTRLGPIPIGPAPLLRPR
jgi:hypothetical protein